MPEISNYPNKDIEKASKESGWKSYARIADVTYGSPAYDAGFEPGCFITSVDGDPVRDVIDWRWLSGEESINVGYIDLDGESGVVNLCRNPGEDWGFEFDELVFDGVKQCRNACIFCFMRQLPSGMRPSLSLRDDDYRLSFLIGTFVTLTNLTAEDEKRIVSEKISPLRVSLHASDPTARKRLMGKHAQHGIDALDRLLSAGIEFHAQIVLVPNVNDGNVLVDTLNWAYERPGIVGLGIVPLGYTKHQSVFDSSYDDEDSAVRVLDAIAPFQQRAMRERGTPWVFAADEFYINAYRDDLLAHLPPAGFYGDYSMFEDGIGIIRSTVDDWEKTRCDGVIDECVTLLHAANASVYLVSGIAQKPFLDPLMRQSGVVDCFSPLYVENVFFGGNVNVTGLLVGEDIVNAIVRMHEPYAPNAQSVSPRETDYPRGNQTERLPLAISTSRGETDCPRGKGEGCDQREGQSRRRIFLVPRVVFNDDGITLDDMTLDDMKKATGQELHMVSCSPANYFNEIIAIIAG